MPTDPVSHEGAPLRSMPGAAPVAQPADGSATETTSRRPSRTRARRGHPGWQRPFLSLSNRNFRFLFFGTVLFMGSMQMQMLAVGYLTYDITRSALLLGVVQSGFAPSMLVLALFGGAIADRIDRRRIILAAQVWEAAMYLVIAVIILIDIVTWYHLLAMMVFDGIMFSFLGPARQAIIPQMVGKEMVTGALAMSAAAMSLMTLTTPAIAGWLYAWLGPEGVFFITAVMALLAALLTRFIPPVPPSGASQKKTIMADIRDGLVYIRQTKLVMVLLIMGGATALFAMPFKHLLPVLMVEIYDRGPEAMGLMLSFMGLGSLIGALSIASMGRWKRGLVLISGTLVTGVGLSLIAAIPMYYAAVGLTVLIGLGDSTRRTLYNAILVEHTEDSYRGRVMSVWMLNFSLMPLGMLPGGLVADWLGGQAAVGMFAVAVLVTGMIVLVTQTQLRRLQ